MDVIDLPLGQIIPYARNPRCNEKAIATVAASIAEFGWRQPIVVDEAMVVLAGHTRLAAAQHFLGIVQGERKRGGLPPIMAFVNRADPHPRSRENAETMQALGALDMITPLKAKLVQRLAFRRSFSEGLAVFELEPSSKAADELHRLARAIYR